MVVIPAGEYLIGNDSGLPNARPAHRVTLGAFGIARHETTVAEYSEYVAAVAVPAPGPDTARLRGDIPIRYVAYNDAVNYCRWRHPDGGRLPTEQEWEAAARGVDGRHFPWGNEPIGGRANILTAGRDGPTPAGSFPGGSTAEGISDLIGNVWEWTSSPMVAYPGGMPLPDSMKTFRVIRGGAFNTLRAHCQRHPPATIPA